MTAPSTTFLDLFSGAGGLSLGFQQAGWKPLLAVDHWPDAIRTYRANFEGHPAEDADVKDLTTRRLAQLLPERPTWVVGGPPCQGFSTVGKRVREDPRNQLVREFRRIVDVLRPDGFVIENVLGLKDMKVHASLTDLFNDIGYAVSFHVFRAADYGVPQLRRRVVFVGHREGLSFSKPQATHATFTSVWDAIGDLPEVGPGQTATAYTQHAFNDYQRTMRKGSSGLQGHTVSAHPDYLVQAISFIPDGGNRRSIVRADSAWLAACQDRLERPWKRFAEGCRCNRATVELIDAAGFSIEHRTDGTWRAMPAIVRPIVLGSAAR